jgi:integrase
MISVGEMVYLPKFTGRKETVLPHIFTQEELMAFFEKVDGYIPHTTRRDDRRMGNEYRMLFRLLYCCGLRNSEGCGIAKDQVDLDNGILTILDSKGNKDRLVYISEDLLLLCRKYFNYLCRALNSEPRWFFPGKNPEIPLRNTSVDRVFNRFWAKTKFSSSCNNKPTVHDLRFTFVTDRINLWVLQGKNTELMMPYLQKYLGHKSIQESYYYYHTSKQLFDAIRSRDKTADIVIPEVADDE